VAKTALESIHRGFLKFENFRDTPRLDSPLRLPGLGDSCAESDRPELTGSSSGPSRTVWREAWGVLGAGGALQPVASPLFASFLQFVTPDRYPEGSWGVSTGWFEFSPECLQRKELFRAGCSRPGARKNVS